MKKFFRVLKEEYGTIMIIVIALAYYGPFINQGPLNEHIWRQTDCISLTINYFEGSPFFEPEMHNQLADKLTSGKTAGEFPLLYYVVGQVWKVTGISFFTYRFLTGLLLVIGLISFKKALKILLSNEFWASFLALLLFTSPVIVLYGAGFLTDVPAFSLVLIALYFITLYGIRKKAVFFAISMTFFALGGLLKTSSLIPFFFLACILFIETIRRYGFKRKILVFRVLYWEWLGFMLVVVSVFSWYYYAEMYNATHVFKYTFNNIWPIWGIETSNLDVYLSGLKDHVSYMFFSRMIISSLLILWIFNLVMWRSINYIAALGNIIVPIGVVTYFLLWGAAFGNHDYYLVPIVYLLPAIVLPAILVLRGKDRDKLCGSVPKTLAGIILIFSLLYSFSVVRLNTLGQKGPYYFVGGHDFVKTSRWYNWDISGNWMRFNEMQGFLKEIGVKEEDKVISLPDKSLNASLVLMNRKGWTDFKCYTTAEQIKELIDAGASYLIISEESLLNSSFLERYLHDQVGEYKGIRIFSLLDIESIN